MSALFRTSILAAMTAVLVLNGCASTGMVQAIPSPGVDSISSSLAIYPLLSAREIGPVRSGHPYGPLNTRSLTLGDSEHVYLAPPAHSELAVTSSSQILTGELSLWMTRSGFSLKEVPYEVADSEGDDDGGYVISMALLETLREEYGLDAIVIGNAFFTRDPRYGLREIRVSAVYLKVVDIHTLEVLCQVAMSYDPYGRELNDVARKLTAELADLAGLETQ